jgi:hypothetical protein
MNATSIFFGLLIVLFMIQHWMRKAKPQIAGGAITKDVSELWTDHVSIKGRLLGVWQSLHSGRALDFKEMNRSFCSRFPRKD